MAVRVCTASSTLTSGTWYRAESASLAFMQWNLNAYYDDVNTTRYLSVTFANAGNQIGLVLYHLQQNTDLTSYNLVIKLQEYSGGTWVDRTTDTFAGTDANFPGRNGLNYYPLTTYAVTTAASTWRYSISCTTSAKFYIVRDNVAANYIHAALLDVSTAAPSSGDTIIIGTNKTMTNNATFTYGETNYISLALCMGSTFAWDGSASYTATFSGFIMPSDESAFTVGTEASPISAANKAIIDISNYPTGSAVDGRFVMASAPNNLNSMSAAPKNRGMIISMWGAYEANLVARIAADANTGQKVITTRENMQGVWSPGEYVSLYGGMGNDYAKYEIDTIVGTTITLKTNIATAKCYKDGAIVNVTRGQANQGIEIQGGTSNRPFANTPASYMMFRYIEMVGIYCNRTNLPFYYTMAASPTRPSKYKHIFVYWKNYFIFNIDLAGCWSGSTSVSWVEMDDFILYPDANVNSTDSLYYVNKSGPGVFSNIYMKGGNYTGLNFKGIDVTCDNVVISGFGMSPQAYQGIVFKGTKITATDWLLAPANTFYMDVSVGDFDGVRFPMSGTSTLKILQALDVKFTNSFIGSDTSSTYEINFDTGALGRIICDSTSIGSYGVTGITTAAPTSYVRFQNYNSTANDHRSWLNYGKQVSTGDGLTDTTVHTSGTGKFALRFEPLSSATNLDWTFTIPTGNIATKTMTVTVWVKINSATFYAGTHQKPRLTVNYDNGTLAYAEALGNTNWQLLAVSFTPTTSYGQITVTVSGRTDATGSDAYFHIDDFGVAYPPSTSLDLGGMDNWANALPVTPPIALPISALTVAQGVWQQLTTTSWGTGSLGESVKTIPGKIKFINDGELPIY